MPPAPGPHPPGELAVTSSKNTLMEPEGPELGCPPRGRKIGRVDPQDTSLAGHHLCLPGPRAGSCLSRGWVHTAAAEMHLLGLAGDTFLARRRDIWSAREVPSPSREPWPGLNSASYLKAVGEARVILQ